MVADLLAEQAHRDLTEPTATGYNDHVAALMEGHRQAGHRAGAEVIASSSDLMGLRVRVTDQLGAEVDSYTDWYSLAADAPVDPEQFLVPGAAEELARPAAVAAAAGASTIRGILPVLPRPVARSLSFTGTGELYWEFVEQGQATGYSAPADEQLTELGSAAAAAAAAPANPRLPRPAPDCTAQQCIALTFDDGPAAETTPILDALAAHNSVGTFFVNGRNMSGQDAVLARIRDEGHQLGNHTQDHPSLSTLPPEGVAAQLQAVAQRLIPYPTAGSPIMRPPYGEFNAAARTEIAKQGYAIILWDVDPQDWATDDPQVIIDRVLGNTERGSIVLSHDTKPATVAAYQTLIPELIRRGFTLVTVSELLGPTAPGEVHFRG